MIKKVINLNRVDFTKQPMFFGEGLNIQRYDVFKYKKFFDSFKEQTSFFWRPEEVSLDKDVGDFKNLTDHQQSIFTKNLLYQTLLDSVQARSIPYISSRASLPELEAACSSWQFFEQIHSYSYTYIIKNVYSNAAEIFDSALDNPQIVQRATSVTQYYNDLINSFGDSLEEQKKKLYLTLVSINILEGIRFYVSFACSFCFAQNKTMEGNAKIISLINRDENLHLAMSQNILKILRTEKSEGFLETVEACEEIVRKMYSDAAQEEMDWANYIFKDGSMLGLNADVLILYMKFLTNKRTDALKIKSVFPEKVENPINWIKNWTESKEVQVAPQETEIESYKSGSVKNDTSRYNFKKYDI